MDFDEFWDTVVEGYDFIDEVDQTKLADLLGACWKAAYKEGYKSAPKFDPIKDW